MIRLSDQQKTCVLHCISSKGFVRVKGVYRAGYDVTYSPSQVQPLIDKKVFSVLLKSKTGIPLAVIPNRLHANVERFYYKLAN